LIAHAASQLCYFFGAALQRVGDIDGAHAIWARGLDVARSQQVNQVAYWLDVALATGRTDPDAFGPLPLPAPGVRSTSEPDSGLVDVETRLRSDRASLELEAIP
jgi:hypothetical protein